MSSKHSLRSRSFCMILYQDDDSHMNLLDFIVENFNYAFIYHDKDKFDQDIYDPNTKELLHKAGDMKKGHFHVVIDFPNPRSLNNLKDQLKIDFIMTCNFFTYIRYLIHADNPEKYQYKREEIETNMLERVYNIIGKEYKKEEQETRLLYNYLKSKNFQASFINLTEYAIDNGLLQELKRNVYFYKTFCSY